MTLKENGYFTRKGGILPMEQKYRLPNKVSAIWGVRLRSNLIRIYNYLHKEKSSDSRELFDQADKNIISFTGQS